MNIETWGNRLKEISNKFTTNWCNPEDDQSSRDKILKVEAKKYCEEVNLVFNEIWEYVESKDQNLYETLNSKSRCLALSIELDNIMDMLAPTKELMRSTFSRNEIISTSDKMLFVYPVENNFINIMNMVFGIKKVIRAFAELSRVMVRINVDTPYLDAVIYAMDNFNDTEEEMTQDQYIELFMINTKDQFTTLVFLHGSVDPNIRTPQNELTKLIAKYVTVANKLHRK